MKISIDKSWTLFLDRDGVINRRNFQGYITKVKDFEFLPFAVEGIQKLQTQFSRIVIVTNQQGIGKGQMSLSNLEEIHQYMLDVFQKNGITVDKICVATNLRDVENDRRKPNPAMAFEAKKEFPEIDFEKSIMVGDTDGDIEFGMNLGMKTVVIQSEEKVNLQPDWMFNNLKELADEIGQ